jgi:RecB family endonuclease NucS
VAIEVKRRATLESLDQLSRYLEVLATDTSLGPIRGILVALSVPPQVKKLAWHRGIKTVEVSYDELRGVKRDDLTLF